jgi:Retrotransposon gag protein/Zinc knuckle
MSDDGMATPNISNNGGFHRLVAKPEYFHGERQKLEDWIVQMTLYLRFSQVEDPNKVPLAMTYLRGRAQDWCKPILSRYLKEDNQEGDVVDDIMENYTTFIERIKATFGTTHDTEHAERVLLNGLRQTTSVANYWNDFEKHAIQTDFDDNTLSTIFKRGLKFTVKQELMRTGTSTEKYRDLVNEAIRLDNELFELAQEAKDYQRTTNGYVNEKPRPFNNSIGRGAYNGNNGRQNNKYSDPYGLQPMDDVRRQLGQMSKGQGTKKVHKKDGSKSGITCYACGKIGHISRDCQNKNKVRRQLNMLKRQDATLGSDEQDSDDDTWTVVTSEMGRLIVDTPDEESDDGDVSPLDLPPLLNPGQHNIMDEERPPTPHPAAELTKKEKREIYDTIKKQMSNGYAYASTSNIDWDQDEPLDYSKLNIVSGYKPIFDKYKAPEELLTENSEGSQPRDDFSSYSTLGTTLFGETRRQRDRRIGLQERRRARAYYRQPNWERHLEPTNRQEARVKHLGITYTVQQGHAASLNQDPEGTRYYLDTRNPRHSTCEWMRCIDDLCKQHYQDKCEAGWFPSHTLKCKKQWYDCENDICETHLWDKRLRPWFPGHEDNHIMQMQIVVNGRCTQDQWQTCLNNDCKRHLQSKQQYGFDESFLGLRQTGLKDDC